MTEVDYSQEAYDRYLRTRARVADWAVHSSAHAREYTHPFDSHQPRVPAGAFGPAPDVRPDDSISLYDGGARRRAEERRRAHTHDAAHARRPAPPPQPQQVYYLPPADGAHYAARPSPAHAHSYKASHARYPSSRPHEIVLPPGGTYKVYTPDGRVQVVSPGGSPHRPHHSRGSSRTHSPHPISPAHGGSYVQLPLPASKGYVYGAQAYAPGHGAQPSHKKQDSRPFLRRLFTHGSDKDKPKSGRRGSY